MTSKTFVRAALFVLMAGLVAPCLCKASSGLSCQRLDSSKSSVRFDATLGLVQVAGYLQDVSGYVLVDPEDLSRSSVYLRINPVAVQLSSAGAAGIYVESLLRSLPEHPFEFKSSHLTRVSDVRYRAEGILTRGSQRRMVSFPVDVVKSDRTNSRVRSRIEGGGFSLIPSAGPAGELRGVAAFELVFKSTGQRPEICAG